MIYRKAPYIYSYIPKLVSNNKFAYILDSSNLSQIMFHITIQGYCCYINTALY